MSTFGVEPEDMTEATFIDESLDVLLADVVPPGADAALQELALVVQQIQETYPALAIPPGLEDVHMAAIMDVISESRSRVPQPVETRRTSAPSRLRTAAMAWPRKVAIAGLSLSSLFGGMAYAGILPDQLQQAAAEVADLVGVDLPAPADDAEQSGSAEATEAGSDDPKTWESPDLRVEDPAFRGEGPRTSSGSRGGSGGDGSRQEVGSSGSDDSDRVAGEGDTSSRELDDEDAETQDGSHPEDDGGSGDHDDGGDAEEDTSSGGSNDDDSDGDADQEPDDDGDPDEVGEDADTDSDESEQSDPPDDSAGGDEDGGEDEAGDGDEDEGGDEDEAED